MEIVWQYAPAGGLCFFHHFLKYPLSRALPSNFTHLSRALSNVQMTPFQGIPVLETMREIWPEGTCPQDQLYGDKQQLRRTADFIIKSGVTDEGQLSWEDLPTRPAVWRQTTAPNDSWLYHQIKLSWKWNGLANILWPSVCRLRHRLQMAGRVIKCIINCRLGHWVHSGRLGHWVHNCSLGHWVHNCRLGHWVHTGRHGWVIERIFARWVIEFTPAAPADDCWV
jgi:hypothetical protein